MKKGQRASEKRWPKFQVHRGLWKVGHIENSLEALVAAKQHGAEMVEFDIRFTKDQVPVLHHDADLFRIYGISKDISTCSWQELREICEITSLEEVLLSDQVPHFLNIEFKSTEVLSIKNDLALANLLARHSEKKEIVVSSFNPFVLQRLKLLLPQLPLALLVTEKDEPSNYQFLQKMWLRDFCGASMLNLDQQMISQPLLKDLKNKGFIVNAWTVNDESSAIRLLDWGVDSIITDQFLELKKLHPVDS
jgi:glycerophosphoryl diester phosphodiesterase